MPVPPNRLWAVGTRGPGVAQVDTKAARRRDKHRSGAAAAHIRDRGETVGAITALVARTEAKCGEYPQHRRHATRRALKRGSAAPICNADADAGVGELVGAARDLRGFGRR